MHITDQHRLNGYIKGSTPGSLLHIEIVEKALGRTLPEGSEVHHVDGNRENNSPSNLVLCPSAKYHSLLHIRQRVMDAGGCPEADKICTRCQSVKTKIEFCSRKGQWDGRNNICKNCSATYVKKFYVWDEVARQKQRDYRASKKAAA